MISDLREKMIDECVSMTAELNGVEEYIVDRRPFELLTVKDLTSEWEWLNDMVFLK